MYKLVEGKHCVDNCETTNCFTLDCGHRWCEECFVIKLNTNIENKQTFICGVTLPGSGAKQVCKEKVVSLKEFGFSANYARVLERAYNRYDIQTMRTQQCPKCTQVSVRYDENDRLVVCSRMNCRAYFCFWCAKLCGTNGTCSNQNCIEDPWISPLLTCETQEFCFGTLKQVVPALRACPRCGFVFEHSDGCKHMKCKMCKTEYCHICLSIKTNNKWPCGDSPLMPCPQILPRQTVLASLN